MKKLVAANWKMNKTAGEAASFIREFKKIAKDEINAEIVVRLSFTALSDVSAELKKSNIRLGAQNMHFENSGAFTGEISTLMLKELGIKYVILGHSERRQYFNETDEII